MILQGYLYVLKVNSNERQKWYATRALKIFRGKQWLEYEELSHTADKRRRQGLDSVEPVDTGDMPSMEINPVPIMQCWYSSLRSWPVVLISE